MQWSEFHVVLIDDEPDVHEVSRLAMRGFRVHNPSATNAAAYYMARGSVPVPDWEVFVSHHHLRIPAALWKQAS